MIIKETFQNTELEFVTKEEVFSPSGLDTGTKAMLSFVKFAPSDKVLDLGCGYGFVGIYAAKQIGAERVTMCDVLPQAVEASKENAARNGVEGVQILLSDGLKEIMDCDYTYILSNPPYHTDFAVAKGFIEDGFKHLLVGGRMVMVTKRLDWYKNKLTAVFGGVSVKEKDGYYIFIAEKRSVRKPKKEKAEAADVVEEVAEKVWKEIGMEANMRIGTGYDVHRLVEERALILGGVVVPYEKGLLGHSDADVLLHAVMDALLGAAALGDIGKHFPDSDERYRGISSMALLKEVKALLDAELYIVENIDATIIAQRPKLAPYLQEMRENIANTLEIDISQVNVKATTEEGLGFTGSGEGIASQAVCLLENVRNYTFGGNDAGAYAYEEGMSHGTDGAHCAGCKGCQSRSEL